MSGFSKDSSDDEALTYEGIPSNFEGTSNAQSNEKIFVDPLAHVSNVCFYFNRDTHDLMVRALQGDSSITLEDLKTSSLLLDLKKWRR